MRRRLQVTIERLRSGLAGVFMLLPGVLAADATGTVLWYLEQEAGGEPYRVRYLVTADFMRSDDGSDAGDFALLDRGQRRIFSVVAETASVLTIDGEAVPPQAPESLSIDVQETVDRQAPKLEGRQPLRLALRADGEVCQSAVVVPGLLDEVRAAFREFARVLAVQQARTLANTPAEFQTPCVLARDVYAGDFHLAAGLPLLEWNDEGDRRELQDYQLNVPLAETLFLIPDGLSVYEIPVPGSGAKVD